MLYFFIINYICIHNLVVEFVYVRMNNILLYSVIEFKMND